MVKYMYMYVMAKHDHQAIMHERYTISSVSSYNKSVCMYYTYVDTATKQSSSAHIRWCTEVSKWCAEVVLY